MYKLQCLWIDNDSIQKQTQCMEAHRQSPSLRALTMTTPQMFCIRRNLTELRLYGNRGVKGSHGSSWWCGISSSAPDPTNGNEKCCPKVKQSCLVMMLQFRHWSQQMTTRGAVQSKGEAKPLVDAEAAAVPHLIHKWQSDMLSKDEGKLLDDGAAVPQ